MFIRGYIYILSILKWLPLWVLNQYQFIKLNFLIDILAKENFWNSFFIFLKIFSFFNQKWKAILDFILIIKYCVSMHTIYIIWIYLSKNLVMHSRTKHIEIIHHFLRDHVSNDDCCIEFVDNEHQLVDIFTKPLARDRNFFY